LRRLFRGEIDEVMVFSRPFRASEMQALAARTN
jgi:hypothetical protein